MFSDFDCPSCKGIGERTGETVCRPTGITRRIRRCRRCHGTGLI